MKRQRTEGFEIDSCSIFFGVQAKERDVRKPSELYLNEVRKTQRPYGQGRRGKANHVLGRFAQLNRFHLSNSFYPGVGKVHSNAEVSSPVQKYP